jgi:hypothetical protein
MGNRYELKICSSCKEETLHRVYKRFGKANKGKGKGKKGLKRIVSWCLECQKRTIENKRKRKLPYAI